MTEVNLLTTGPLQIKSLNNSLPLSAMDIAKFQVDTSPSSRILLMSETEASIDIFVTSSLAGDYAITLPLTPSCKYAFIDNLIVIVHVINPRIRFDSCEVDFGLIGVGCSLKKILCFTNESDVAVRYDFTSTVHTGSVDSLGQQNKKSLVNDFSVSANTVTSSMARILNKNKIIGRNNSIYSQKGDETSRSNMTEATQDSYKLNGLKTSSIIIEPNNGFIKPQGTVSVSVNCTAGNNSERLRGILECYIRNDDNENNSNHIHNNSHHNDDNSSNSNNTKNSSSKNYNNNNNNNNNCNYNNNVISQYIAFRGEVQTPKTALYPIHHNIGILYVGVPIQFKINLQNICNLLTKFKFERPNGESKNYKIVFKPQKGDLNAKEIKKIKIEITPLITGYFKDVIACKILGLSAPLGFSITGEVSTYFLLLFSLLFLFLHLFFLNIDLI